MEMQLVRTTQLSELHALGLSGQPVMLAFDQLARHLKRAISAQHAALFCEPVVDSRRGTVDWYAPADSPTQPLAGLTTEARAAVETTLAAQLGDIQAHVEALQRSSGEAEKLLADRLLLAMEVPGPDYVYVVGDQPVLAGWGSVHQGPGAPRGVLMRFVRPSRPALEAGRTTMLASVPAVPAQTAKLVSFEWLWWLLGSLLMILLLLLLLYWQRPNWMGFLHMAAPAPSCRISDSDLAAFGALDTEQARGAALRQQLADLQKALLAKHAQCAPSQHSSLPSDNADQQRVAQSGGHAGQLQVTLAWDDTTDLDLSVVCPDGEVLSYRHRQGCAGGALDVDANQKNGNIAPTNTPVENVFWEGEPPPGQYQVVVDFFYQRVNQASPFRVTVNLGGKLIKRIDGVISDGEHLKKVFQFSTPGG